MSLCHSHSTKSIHIHTSIRLSPRSLVLNDEILYKTYVEKKCSGAEVVDTLNRIRGFNPRPFSSHIKHCTLCNTTELKSLIFTIMYRLKNYSQVDQYKSEI